MLRPAKGQTHSPEAISSIKEQICRAFAALDPERTGRFRIDLLRRVLRALDPGVTDEGFDVLVKGCGGRDGDLINYRSFLGWLIDEQVKDVLNGRRLFGGGAGNLCYGPAPAFVQRAEEIIKRIHAGEDLGVVLQEMGEKRLAPKPMGSGRRRIVFFTDLEPDDTMAVAQVWQKWCEKGDVNMEPLIMFGLDFDSKDGDTVYEKKLLVATLMLGTSDFRRLPPVGVALREKPHPREASCIEHHAVTINKIVDDVANFEGDFVEFYILAPGRGNIGALMEGLRARGAWPAPKARWNLSMYSGSFNMRGMYDSDIVALSEFMKCSDKPLVDCGKFPFFGGNDCHRWTESLTTFALPDFASNINAQSPLLAASLKLFNDEHNAGLLKPSKIFKKPGLDGEDELAARFKLIEPRFKAKDYMGYAKALIDDGPLFDRVQGFKKSTLVAFAVGGCDSPLCDQLVFLNEWLVETNPSWVTQDVGVWVFDKEKGFTCVRPRTAEDDASCIAALQPALTSPKDEAGMWAMRTTLQTYLLQHINCLKLAA